MRKLTKTAAVVASMAVMAMGTVATVSADTPKGEWNWENNAWYYYDLKENKTVNTWVYVDTENGRDWYFVDDEGKMVTNAFVRVDRFADDDAEVLRDKDIHDVLGKDDIDDDADFYYIGSDGKMVTGWKKMDASSIYASPNSGASTEVWYYFGTNGRMYVNEWVKSNGIWYAISPNGQMYEEAVVNNDLVNWDDEDFYYMGTNGALVKGWHEVDKDKRAGSDAQVYIDGMGNKLDDFSPIMFPSDGKWVYGDSETGVLADEEWKKIDGKWYYFGRDARTTREGVKDDYLDVYIATGNLTLDDLVPELGEGIVTGAAAILPRYDITQWYQCYYTNEEHKDDPQAEADDKYVMLSNKIIAWQNHEATAEDDTSPIKYFYLGSSGDALTTWKEIEDDYWICGDSKGQLYNDTIAKVNNKYYYFNANGVCDNKYLNNTADYVVVYGSYGSGGSIGSKEFYFYETNRINDSNDAAGNADEERRSLYSNVDYANLAEIKDILDEAGVKSVTFGSTRKVKLASLTEAEAVAAYSVYAKHVSEPKEAEQLSGSVSETVSIYKLRTSSVIEKQKVTLNIK